MSYLGEVMEVTPQWCAGPTMILIDSGAFTHTCPRWFCDHLPIEQSAPRMRAVTASGKPLSFYGVRRVRARTWCNREIIFEFQVSDVTRPIASVGLLRHRGHPVSFGRWPHIIIAGEPTPLVEAANLFYLPVALPGERLPPMLVEQMQRQMATLQDNRMLQAAIGVSPQIKLFEYCCGAESLLSQWFLDHGYLAQRLCLPDHDMSRQCNVEALVRELSERIAQHQFTAVWTALPCTPWCSW